MVPSKTNPCWKKVLTSESEPSFKNISVSMMITRLRNKVKADAGSIESAIDEMHTFFTKFETNMQDDIALIA